MSKKRNLNGKLVPAMCKKCALRAVADPKAAMEIQATMQALDKSNEILWEVVGRALHDAHGGCPVHIFEKDLPDWCKTDMEVCGYGNIKKDAGDKNHPYWKCWTRYLGSEMLGGGRYQLSKLHKERDEENGK